MTVAIDPGMTKGIYVFREGGETPAVGDKILGWTEITDTIVPGSLKFALTKPKMPTPALVEGCLIKAIDGDERCQAIWKRWMWEADDVLKGIMLGAINAQISRALGS